MDGFSRLAAVVIVIDEQVWSCGRRRFDNMHDVFAHLAEHNKAGHEGVGVKPY
jgi:hypothetical protein